MAQKQKEKHLISDLLLHFYDLVGYPVKFRPIFKQIKKNDFSRKPWLRKQYKDQYYGNKDSTDNNKVQQSKQNIHDPVTIRFSCQFQTERKPPKHFFQASFALMFKNNVRSQKQKNKLRVGEHTMDHKATPLF